MLVDDDRLGARPNAEYRKCYGNKRSCKDRQNPTEMPMQSKRYVIETNIALCKIILTW